MKVAFSHNTEHIESPYNTVSCPALWLVLSRTIDGY